MLNEEDIDAIRAGRFERHCLRMRLERCATASPEFYEGPGRIYQDGDRELRFELYAPGAPVPRHRFYPVGQLLPPEAYWELSATDLHGNVWGCPQVNVEPGWSAPGGGSVVASRLAYIKGRAAPGRAVDGCAFRGYTFQPLRFPANASTTVETTRAGERRTFRSRRDVSAFEAEGYRFEIWDNAGLSVVSARGVGTLPPQFSMRVAEALQFVCTLLVSWDVELIREGAARRAIIRGRPSESQEPGIERPIRRNTTASEDNARRLFECYLRHVLPFDDANSLHPLSAEWGEVLRASTGSIETQALISCVAVERLCRLIAAERPATNQAEAALLEWTSRTAAFLTDAGCPDTFQRRIVGCFRRMGTTAPTDVLRELEREGAVDAELVRVWQQLRPTSAHGDHEGQGTFEDLIRRADAVLSLLYQMCFHIIGYRG